MPEFGSWYIYLASEGSLVLDLQKALWVASLLYGQIVQGKSLASFKRNFWISSLWLLCAQLHCSLLSIACHQFSVRWVRRGEALQIFIFGGPIDSVNLVPRAFSLKKMRESLD